MVLVIENNNLDTIIDKEDAKNAEYSILDSDRLFY
jgi:hypothetical protein